MEFLGSRLIRVKIRQTYLNNVVGKIKVIIGVWSESQKKKLQGLKKLERLILIEVLRD